MFQKSESKKRPRHSSGGGASETNSARKKKIKKHSSSKKARFECDAEANFDISSIFENGSSLSTGDSESDFEVDMDYYTVMPR